jgi:hypothetical protein
MIEPNAPVAQPDRATGFEPVGREFESLRAHHPSSVLSSALIPALRRNEGTFRPAADLRTQYLTLADQLLKLRKP